MKLQPRHSGESRSPERVICIALTQKILSIRFILSIQVKTLPPSLILSLSEDPLSLRYLIEIATPVSSTGSQ